MISVCILSVAVDKQIHMYAEVRSAKGFAAKEVKVQKPQKTMVQQKPQPTVREVEDEWYMLLDVAPKLSGIIKMITNKLHRSSTLTLYV